MILTLTIKTSFRTAEKWQISKILTLSFLTLNCFNGIKHSQFLYIAFKKVTLLVIA